MNLRLETQERTRAAGSEREVVVVVGHGMVGQRFCERLRDLCPDRYQLFVIGEEPVVAYDRVHLTDLFQGRSVEDLALRAPDWFAEHGVDVHVDDPVLRIDPESRTVWSKSGLAVRYDHLVLATGSRAAVPPIEGTDQSGVFVYRTAQDVLAIRDAVEEARQRRGGDAPRVAIIGGGLLGLEAARALQLQGCDVTVGEAAAQLMPKQLDGESAALLAEQIRQLGIEVRVAARVAAITSRASAAGGDEFVLEERRDEDGGPPDMVADVVVLAAGVRARDELAADAGIAVNLRGGVKVDEHLATSAPGVHAIGECACYGQVPYGLVAPGYEMADALARRLAGEDARFVGAATATRLKMDAVEIAVAGEHLTYDGEDVLFRAPGVYRRVVLDGSVVVAAVAVGEWAGFARVQEAIASARTIGWRERRRFLRSGELWARSALRPIDSWPDRATVCSCTGVSCGQLRVARSAGCDTVAKLADRTGASTVCGTCEPLLAELVGAATTSAPPKLQVGLLAAALVAAVLAVVTVVVDPIAVATTVQGGPHLDILWRESWVRQVSGFSLAGIMAISLVISLRKRYGWTFLGRYTRLRTIHGSLGAATLIAAAVHTGFRLGHNLDFALMATFLGLSVLGALAGAVVAVEAMAPANVGGPLRRLVTRGHELLFWPLPILVLFHVVKVYYY